MFRYSASVIEEALPTLGRQVSWDLMAKEFPREETGINEHSNITKPPPMELALSLTRLPQNLSRALGPNLCYRGVAPPGFPAAANTPPYPRGPEPGPPPPGPGRFCRGGKRLRRNRRGPGTGVAMPKPRSCSSYDSIFCIALCKVAEAAS